MASGPDPSRFLRAQLVERAELAEDLALMTFEPLDGEPVPSFVPGQYATLAWQDEAGKLVQRPYSLVSAPHEPKLEFFLELVPEGALTPKLWQLQRGDEVWVRKRIVGRFTLQRSDTVDSHLLIATVTGIAPYVSMVRHLTHEAASSTTGEAPPNVVVLHGGSRSWELGYADELTRRAAEQPWLTYIPTISRPWEDPDWRGQTGRVDELVRLYTDRLELTPTRTMAYTCGHPGMIENVRGILRRARYPKEHIKEESYF